jgi:hypothetical protein
MSLFIENNSFSGDSNKILTMDIRDAQFVRRTKVHFCNKVRSCYTQNMLETFMDRWGYVK